MESRGFLGDLGDFFDRTGVSDVFRRIGSSVSSPGSAQIPTSQPSGGAVPATDTPKGFPWLVFVGGVLVAGTAAALIFRK